MNHAEKLALIKGKYTQNSGLKGHCSKQNKSSSTQNNKQSELKKLINVNYKKQRTHNRKNIIDKSIPQYQNEQLLTPKNKTKVLLQLTNDNNNKLFSKSCNKYDQQGICTTVRRDEHKVQQTQKDQKKFSSTQRIFITNDNQIKKDLQDNLQLLITSQQHAYEINRKQSKQCIRQVEQTLQRIKKELIQYQQ